MFLGQLAFLVERCNLAFSLTALNIETASLMIAFVVTTACVATCLVVPPTLSTAPLPWFVAE